MSLETIFYCKAKEAPTNPACQRFTLLCGNQYIRVYEDGSAVGTHMTYFPDLRFGQLINNVLGWHYSKSKRDIFFPEEDEMIQIFEDYVKETTKK